MFDTCVILAGGRGTRLQPLTDNCPKPMISINGSSFIQYVIEHLISHGISNIIILAGFKAEKFLEITHDYDDRSGLSVRMVVSDERLNTLERVALAINELSGHILVCYGDVYSDVDLSIYFEFCKRSSHETHSISAISRHNKLTRDNVFDCDYQEPIKYKDIGYHAFHSSWIKKYLPLTGDLNLKFEDWYWNTSNSHLTYHDDWTYGSLTDIKSLSQVKSQFLEKATLILDRDGVINIKPPKGTYVTDPADLSLNEFLKGFLKKHTHFIERIIIVTNQPWIDGIEKNEMLHGSVKSYICNWLSDTGIVVDYLHCPHSYLDRCACRKPKARIITKYLECAPFLRRKVVVIGDQLSDAIFASHLGDVSFYSLRYDGERSSFDKLETIIKPKLCIDHRYYRLCGLPHGRFDSR